MPPFICRISWKALLLVPVLWAGCAAPRQQLASYRPSAGAGGVPCGMIFVANGAGDFGTVSRSLAQVLEQTNTPLDLKTVDWSLGYRRYVADQVNHDNHLAQGRRLADEIVAYRGSYPGRRVYLIGHSAGCAILLAAADLLPPDSVDRIVLLAPSVCRSAYLRPSLRAARCGIDVFYSDRDRWILGLGMRIFGTTEGGCREAAGKHGFTPAITPADAGLYARLHQHPWSPELERDGHDGGHFGSSDAAFLRARVLPLLVCN